MAQVIRSAQVDHEPVLIRCRREEPLPLEMPAPAPMVPAAATFIEPAAPIEDPREALDELRRQAAQEGYREGLERGEREGKASLAEETERLRGLAASIGEALDRAIGGAEDAMVEIAFAAACKVLGEAAVTEEGVRAMVQQAARQLRAKENLVLRVAAADHARLAGKIVVEGARLEVVADERVTLGGCLVETAGGTLDARLEVQLRQLVDTLARAKEAQGE
jgi:flagellar assembly protein FliH